MSTLDVTPPRCARRSRRIPVVRSVTRDPELSPRPADRGDRAAAGRGAASSAARAPRWRPTGSCSAPRCCRARCRCAAAPPQRRCCGHDHAAGGSERAGREPARRAGRAGRRPDAAGAVRRARVHLPGGRGPDGGDAQRPARLLRRRHAAAREVAVARARARRPELGGRRPTSTCACPNVRPRASPPARAPRRSSTERNRPALGPSTAADWPTPESTVGGARRAGLSRASTDGEPAAESATARRNADRASTHGQPLDAAEAGSQRRRAANAGASPERRAATSETPPRADRRPGAERSLPSHGKTLNLNLRLRPSKEQSSGSGREFRRSATIVARLDVVVDRAKIPA